MELASLFYGFGMDLDALMVRPEVIGKKMKILAFFYLLFLNTRCDVSLCF